MFLILTAEETILGDRFYFILGKEFQNFQADGNLRSFIPTPNINEEDPEV